MSALAPQPAAGPLDAEEPLSQSRSRRRPAPARRPRVAGGVLWIAVVGTLLAGVVAVNVAVLRLNLQLDRLGRERARLQADNAALSSELSSALSASRIQGFAQNRLGLVPARAAETTYVDLGR